MEQSFIKYRGDGITTQFVVPFPYIYKEHVYVKIALMKSKAFLTNDKQQFIVIVQGGTFLTTDEKVFRTIDNKELEVLSGQQVFESRDRDGESYFDMGFAWITDSIIELPFAPAEGDQVLVYRDSELWNKLVQYSDETMLRSDDLNIDSNQMYFLLQEIIDVGPRGDIDWDAKYIRDIVNNEVSVSVTTGYILERLTDSIGRSQLLQDLRDPLETLENMHSEVTLTANQWTVKIDNNGHVVGTGLILYPSWENDKEYVIDDQVYHNEEVYVCIEDHTGAEPPDAQYWELVPDGVRSEFLIVADRFAIVSPEDPEDLKVPFIVGNVDGVPTIGISGELVVDGSIYGNAIATDAITVGHIGDPEAILNKNQLLKDILDEHGNSADQLIVDLQQNKVDAIIDGKTVIVNGYLNTEFIEANTITADMIVIGELEEELGIPGWEYEDTTLIDGGKIYAGSQIQIGNLDGESDYCKIDDGDIEFYRYIDGYHRLAKSLKRISSGVVSSGNTGTLDGYWTQPPFIMVSPQNLDVYSPNYSGQQQQIRCRAENLTEVAEGIYEFTGIAELDVSGTSASVNVNDSTTTTSEGTHTTGTYTTGPNVSSITINGSHEGYLWHEYWDSEDNTCYNHWNKPLTYDVYVVIGGFDHLVASVDEDYFDQWDPKTSSGSFSHTVAVPEGQYEMQVKVVVHNLDSGDAVCEGEGWVEIEFESYHTDSPGSTVLAEGTLNYIAIGE